VGATLLVRIFAYLSVYRFLIGKHTTYNSELSSAPWQLPIIIITSAELVNFVYVLMMIIGHKTESEHGETLEIIRKLINKTTDSDLIERFRCLSEVIQSSPIQCSCGFFILNWAFFLSVRKPKGTSTNYVTRFSGFLDHPLPLCNKKPYKSQCFYKAS
jgi:hypothetical protein